MYFGKTQAEVSDATLGLRSGAIAADGNRGVSPDALQSGPQSALLASQASRFVLDGVIYSQQAAAAGLALIAIDGSAARPFRIGESVDGKLVLQSVSEGSAALGVPGGPVSITLNVSSSSGTGAGAVPGAVRKAGPAGTGGAGQVGSAQPRTWARPHLGPLRHVPAAQPDAQQPQAQQARRPRQWPIPGVALRPDGSSTPPAD